MSNRRWLGVLAGLLTVVAGCSGNASDAANVVTDESGASKATEYARGGIAAQPMANRLAFMAGHVEAGITLYRAGHPEMAARHLLHPVAESYAEERAGLDALGFDPTLFEVVSKALENGEPAESISAELAAAEAHLAGLATRVGGDTPGIITFLMETLKEEYAAGVADGVVTNAGEYQDAFGFAQVALARSAALPATHRARVSAALNDLLALFSEVPLPSDTPVSGAEINALADEVVKAARVEY